MTQILQETVYAIAGTSDVMYAAQATGLYRSRDGGATWQNTFESLGRSEPLAATAVTVVGKSVFAGVKGAVLRSDDSGDTWQISGLASPPPLVVALAHSPAFADGGLIAAATAEDGVFISSDRGKTWVAWNFGLIDLNVYALAIAPDHTLYAGTESGIFRSHNGGRGWQEVPFPMLFAPVLSLAFSAGALYAGTEQHGLFVSDNGGLNWEQIAVVGAVNALHNTESGVWALLEDRLLRISAASSVDTRLELPKTAMAFFISPGKAIIGFADGEIRTFSA